MTREEIKKLMLKSINATLEEKVLDIESLICIEDIDEFMWTKDFGEELVEEFLEENKAEFIGEYLEEIYSGIGTEDLKAPF